MSESDSLKAVCRAQESWAKGDSKLLSRAGYVSRLTDNLHLGDLNPDSRLEFESADGGELHDHDFRPAKMRALISSSALAVNFFDAWRHTSKALLATALRIGEPIEDLRFEYRCNSYPVGPRTPNLDVMLTAASGRHIAIESKFLECYRKSSKRSLLSKKYFPPGRGVWEKVDLHRAQLLVNDMSARWMHLDAAQLLKHLLGLRSDTSLGKVELLYLWYDTGSKDAIAHRNEIAQFADAVLEESAENAVPFRSMSYQELFATLAQHDAELPVGWRSYMEERYFKIH